MVLLIQGLLLNHGSVVVTNGSTHEITFITIKVCSRQISVENIQIDCSKELNYRVTGDCKLEIEAHLSDGNTLRSQSEYVSNGFNYHTQALVRDETIAVETKAYVLSR